MPLKVKSKKGPTILQKAPTGISGLDEITAGGIPAGRPTLICGSAGAGKTLFAVETIVHGAMEFGEPGIIMTFEEKADELAVNVASLGFDLEKLQRDGLLMIDHVEVHRNEIDETGEYDLDGLFIRLDYAIKKIGAKREALMQKRVMLEGRSEDAFLYALLRGA